MLFSGLCAIRVYCWARFHVVSLVLSIETDTLKDLPVYAGVGALCRKAGVLQAASRTPQLFEKAGLVD
jgi:hypothetical protein